MVRAPLALLAEASSQVAASPSRLLKVRVLSDCLVALAPGEVGVAVHYLSGVLPQGRIGIGYRALQDAAAQPPAVTPQLEIPTVNALLDSLAATSGAGSGARRAALLAELFGAATALEQDFLLRLLAGELRQGALDGIMIDAIAVAAKVPVARVRSAAMYAPDLGRIAAAALADGEAGLAQFRLRLFDPVVPMLAQTAADVREALRELAQPVQFEWKMDGARIQVHKRGAEVRIYTRALNEMSAAIPEILAAAQALPVEEVVLDGEALSYMAGGRPHPFQVTMRRFGRRLNVESLLQELPMRAFFFDCLLLEGEAFVDRPLVERMAALERAVPADARIPLLVTADEAAAAAFYDAALAAGHEGVMAKSLASVYEAGNRGANWFKIKRAHTLDLIVLAAEWGNGRRQGRLSNLHLGRWIRPPANT